MKKKVLLLVISALLLSGCDLDGIEFEIVNSTTKEYNELDFNKNFAGNQLDIIDTSSSSSSDIQSVIESSTNSSTPPQSKPENTVSSSVSSSVISSTSSSKPTTSSSKPASSSVSSSSSIPDKNIIEAPSSDKITVTYFNNTLHRNDDATVEIKGLPNTEYSIKVMYSSGASTAKGLENKVSDSNGYVSWTWHVGGRTALGGGKSIIIKGGGESITLTFSVVG